MNQAKRIPYGLANYGRLKRDNCYYVDKTHFIPAIEAAPYYLIFIRPRRFGKTLWLSTMEHYYDVHYRDQFDALFGDTFIGQNPTSDRNSYLVLSLNFSGVNPNIELVEASFIAHIQQKLAAFLTRYAAYFNEQEQQQILSASLMEGQLGHLFDLVEAKGLKTYLFIDEYDNFANTILTTEGEAAYWSLTHGGGFFRHFFGVLKKMTSGLTRLFITGVSPVTLDDVTSGFNIASNITLLPQFNELLGFNETELRSVLADQPAFPLSMDESLHLMTEWYNHYRFAETATTEVYNSDMVWYFILKTLAQNDLPKNLLDNNVRIDYNKLRHLMLVDKRLNGNFSRLQQIIEQGEIISPIVESFPVEQLLRPENFISLLFYFGLLSIAGTDEDELILRIPNLTVKELMYGYIREGYRDAEVFRIDFWSFARLVKEMAYQGEWRTVFEFLSEQIKAQTSIRNYLNGEKVIQGFLLAYLNVTNHFLLWSEKEMGGGFVDIYLEPFIARYKGIQFGYLLELKYIPRHEFNEIKLQEKIQEAETQLHRYIHDARITEIAQKTTLKGLALVYSGWELVYMGEI